VTVGHKADAALILILSRIGNSKRGKARGTRCGKLGNNPRVAIGRRKKVVERDQKLLGAGVVGHIAIKRGIWESRGYVGIEMNVLVAPGHRVIIDLGVAGRILNTGPPIISDHVEAPPDAPGQVRKTCARCIRKVSYGAPVSYPAAGNGIETTLDSALLVMLKGDQASAVGVFAGHIRVPFMIDTIADPICIPDVPSRRGDKLNDNIIIRG